MDPQENKKIEEKLEQIYKAVRRLRFQIMLGNVISVLVIIIPIGFLVYFLPPLLQQLFSAYLPPGTNPDQIKGILEQFLQQP